MKKTYLTVIALFAGLQFSYAQWTTSGSNVYYNSGNVGIETTSPSSNLQIGTTTGQSTSTPNTFSLGGTFSSTHGSNPKMRVYDDGTNFWGFGISSGQMDYIVSGTSYDHVFFAGGAEIMRVKGSGNVAIGTDDPKGYKFAVNGSAIATSMKVKPNGSWPDFVFLKDYRLPTLTEVKTYIDKNQHLPDMPSADEVHKNGLDLGEMNRLLLKKVEELTLYMIEQKEESEKQKAEYRGQIVRLKQQLDVLTKSVIQK